MIVRGLYYNAIIPHTGGFGTAYLKPTGVYNLYSENPEEISFASLEREIKVSSVLLLPSFLWHAFEEKPHGESRGLHRKERNLIEYPPLAAYKRTGTKVYVRPLESRLMSPAILQVRSPSHLWSAPLGGRGGKIEIEAQILGDILKHNRGEISLIQGDYPYILESFPHFKSAEDSLQKIYLKRRFSYLSVKDVLDPEGGLEKLIADIVGRKFPGAEREKMGKLLDIIRSATAEEEEKIISGLYSEDPPFFEEVSRRLFHDELLPYMKRREAGDLLLQCSDEELAGTIFLSPRHRELYTPFLSKNRMRYLCEDFQLSDQKKEEYRAFYEKDQKSPAWRYLEEWFRKHKERLIALNLSEVHTREPAPQSPRDSLSFSPKWIGAHMKSGSCSGDSSFEQPFWVQGAGNSSIRVGLNTRSIRGVRALSIAVERRRGEFSLFQFSGEISRIDRTLLELPVGEGLARSIFCAVWGEACLQEGFIYHVPKDARVQTGQS